MSNVPNDMTGKFTVREVEERTGVPATSLRQWERRYGFPDPERAESGYRYYSERDVAGILRMRDLVADGVAPSRAAVMAREAHAATADVRSAEALALELGDALIRLDAQAAERLWAEAVSLYTVDTVMLDVITPALVRIGDLWHEGQVSVATEHFASNFLQGRVRSLLRMMPVVGRNYRVVVACAPGEQHEIGALMLATLLKRAGFQVVYLGANTPVADLVQLVQREGFDAVLLSANSAGVLARLREERDLLRDMPALLLLGGGALARAPEQAAEIGGVFLGNDLRKVVPELEALLSRGKAAPGRS